MVTYSYRRWAVAFFLIAVVIVWLQVTQEVVFTSLALPPDPLLTPTVARRSASLSLSARSASCKSPNASYDSFVKHGGYQAAQDGNPGPWLWDFVKKAPSPDKVVVSLGCNKGDDLMTVLSLWDYEFWNVERYVATWNANFKFPAHLRPLSTLAANMSRPQPRNSSMLGICVEANIRSVDALRKMSQLMHFDTAHGVWGTSHQIIHAAVSDTSGGYLEFPDEEPGAWWSNTRWYTEIAWYTKLSYFIGVGVGKNNKELVRASYSKVPVSTADDLLFRRYGATLSGRDMLIFIDVNGEDARALFGLAETLAMGRVTYIEFEYDRRGDWKTRALSEVILFLDSFQFDCFWLMQSGLHRLTGCWDARFDLPAPTWVNVACMSRTDERWWPIIQKWSLAMQD